MAKSISVGPTKIRKISMPDITGSSFENYQILQGRGLDKVMAQLKALENPAKLHYLGPSSMNFIQWVAVVEILGKPRAKVEPKTITTEDTKTSKIKG